MFYTTLNKLIFYAHDLGYISYQLYAPAPLNPPQGIAIQNFWSMAYYTTIPIIRSDNTAPSWNLNTCPAHCSQHIDHVTLYYEVQLTNTKTVMIEFFPSRVYPTSNNNLSQMVASGIVFSLGI